MDRRSRTDTGSERRVAKDYLLRLAAGAGWVIAALFVEAMSRTPLLGFDAHAYWQAGRNLLEGLPVYGGALGERDAFFYAPPLALLTVPLSFLPPLGVWVLMDLVSLAALRYVAGSWRNGGLFFLLFPWGALELVLGNINFLVAAAIVAAFRTSSGPLAAVSLAKLYPALLVPQLWRTGQSLRWLVGTLVVAVAVTAPVLSLWPAWISAITQNLVHPSGEYTLGPLRYGISGLLLGLGWWRKRSWLAALGATLVMPYWSFPTVIIALGPARLFIDDIVARRGSSAQA